MSPSTFRPDEAPRHVDELVRAWKCARLGREIDGAGLVLLPLMGGEPYAVEARAQCAASGFSVRQAGDHQAPGPRCSCGFYAVKKLRPEEVSAANAILEVELAGRIIVGSEGYRAGWQRVLTAWLPSAGCQHRLWNGCDADTTVLVHPHGARTRRTIFGDNESTFTLEPRCDEHLADDDEVLSPRRLSELLGTEVRIDRLERILDRARP